MYARYCVGSGWACGMTQNAESLYTGDLIGSSWGYVVTQNDESFRDDSTPVN